MRYRSQDENLHVNQIVVVERPDRIRIEVMSMFGLSMQITSDGEVVRAYFRGEGMFYSGRATSRNLVRFTRLDLEVTDVTDVLAGLPPERELAKPVSISFEEGRWRLEAPLDDGTGAQILWFDRRTLLPLGTELLDRGGETLWAAASSDFRKLGPATVPHRVTVSIPSRGASLELVYSAVTVNRRFGNELFRFDPPPGAKLVNLDELEPSAAPLTP